jgi:hypothetical protein
MSQPRNLTARILIAVGLLIATYLLFRWTAPQPATEAPRASSPAPAVTAAPTAMPPHGGPRPAPAELPPATPAAPAAGSESATVPAQGSAAAPLDTALPPAAPAMTERPAAPVEPPAQDTAASVAEDLDQLDLMFRDYRGALGENPVGNNAEIMRAVTGQNLKQVKIGLPNGGRLNAEGELIDRWGTPYFFHQLSGREMEIRSAGPDQQMWTNDDAVIGARNGSQ